VASDPQEYPPTTRSSGAAPPLANTSAVEPYKPIARALALPSKVPSYLRDLLPPQEVWEVLTRPEKLKVLEELASEKSGVALHDILERLREKLPYLDERVRKLEEKGLPANPLQLSLTTPAVLRASILWDLIRRVNLLDFYKVDWWGKGNAELYVALKGDRVLFELGPLHSLARALAGDLYTAGVERELERWVRDAAAYLTRKQVNPWEYVAVENGILSLKTFELHEPNSPTLPDCYFTAYVPAPVRESFLRDLREGRITEEYFKGRAFYRLFRPRYDDCNWNLLKRALGSILLPWPEGAIVFVVGETMARKTVLNNLLRRTLGNLCATVDLGVLQESRFATAQLEGARCAVTAEEEDVVVKRVGRIKRITGGDEQRVEEKFKRERGAQVCITLFVFVNRLPKFRKVDSAVKRRALIIRTLETVPHSAEEKNLIEETLRHPEEFFEFLLYCAWELRNRYNELSWGLKTEEEFDRVGEELLLAADNVRRFFEEALKDRESEWHIRYVRGAETYPSHVYHAYKAWCEFYGEEPVSEDEFKRDIEPLLQGIGVSYGRERGGTRKVWRNLALGSSGPQATLAQPEEIERWVEGG
jgi:phage/plasmid-associated DNA primase